MTDFSCLFIKTKKRIKEGECLGVWLYSIKGGATPPAGGGGEPGPEQNFTKSLCEGVPKHSLGQRIV